MSSLHFYNVLEKYGEFSNFYLLKTPIILDDISWNTSEAYYQSQKWNDGTQFSKMYMTYISQANTAYKTFILGRGNFVHGIRTNMIVNKKLASIIDPTQLLTINEVIAIFTNTKIDKTWKNKSLLKKYRNKGRVIVSTVVDNIIPLKIIPSWEFTKLSIMSYVLYNKFLIPELQKILLNTDNLELVEDSKRDLYWGYCDGKGQNMLGKVLMHIRNLLQNNLPYTELKVVGSYVKLSNTIYYGIHPTRVAPDFHIDHFINLTEKQDIVDNYVYNVPMYNYPIKDRKAPTLDYLGKIVDFILTLTGIIYIYCKGGHGRSGTITAALWGKINNLDGIVALKHIDTEWRKQRNLTLLKPYLIKLGSPQTNCQKQVVIKYLT